MWELFTGRPICHLRIENKSNTQNYWFGKYDIDAKEERKTFLIRTDIPVKKKKA